VHMYARNIVTANIRLLIVIKKIFQVFGLLVSNVNLKSHYFEYLYLPLEVCIWLLGPPDAKPYSRNRSQTA